MYVWNNAEGNPVNHAAQGVDSLSHGEINLVMNQKLVCCGPPSPSGDQCDLYSCLVLGAT